LTEYEVEEAIGYLDEDLRIDIVIKKYRKEIAGVQVKPTTFNLMREEVLFFQKKANEKWGNPVFILFYDNNSQYKNFEDIVKKIRELR
jgi:hypothetical protein